MQSAFSVSRFAAELGIMSTNQIGPIYGVPLIDYLPLEDGMRQAMPSRPDLELVRHCSSRTVAGYEVLLASHQRLLEACKAASLHVDELRHAWLTGAITERDGKGGMRSNRNVDVAVQLSAAIQAAEGE